MPRLTNEHRKLVLDIIIAGDNAAVVSVMRTAVDTLDAAVQNYIRRIAPDMEVLARYGQAERVTRVEVSGHMLRRAPTCAAKWDEIGWTPFTFPLRDGGGRVPSKWSTGGVYVLSNGTTHGEGFGGTVRMFTTQCELTTGSLSKFYGGYIQALRLATDHKMLAELWEEGARVLKTALFQARVVTRAPAQPPRLPATTKGERQ